MMGYIKSKTENGVKKKEYAIPFLIRRESTQNRVLVFVFLKNGFIYPFFGKRLPYNLYEPQLLFLYFLAIQNYLPLPQKQCIWDHLHNTSISSLNHEPSSFGNAQFRHDRLFAARLVAHLSWPLGLGRAPSGRALSSALHLVRNRHIPGGSAQLLQKM